MVEEADAPSLTVYLSPTILGGGGGGHSTLRGDSLPRAECPRGHPALGQIVRGVNLP